MALQVQPGCSEQFEVNFCKISVKNLPRRFLGVLLLDLKSAVILAISMIVITGKPVYGVKTSSGVSAACLPAYFEALDAFRSNTIDLV